MSKYKGATNLAEKPRSTLYQRPKDIFYSITPTTGAENVGTSTTGHFLKFDTGATVSTFPLNERLVLGFRDIKVLPNNWDTYGSPSPSAETIDLAERVAQQFPSELQPEIMPERDGSIGLSWETPKFEIELLINSNSENSPRFSIEDIQTGQTFNPFANSSVWEIAAGIRSFLKEELK